MILTRTVPSAGIVESPCVDPGSELSRDEQVSSSVGSLSTVCAAVLVLVAGIIGSKQLHDNSFLTHLATGRWISHGNLSRLWMGTSDPYLWTSGGRRWVVQSWLASVVYDGAERIGGAALVRLLVAGSCMALTAILWRLSAVGRTLVPRVIAVGAALAIGGTAWSERPYLFGLVFLGLVLLAVEGRLRVGWLVPIGWLWVNTHGSFPLGLVAVATVALGARLDGDSVARELRALRNLSVGCVTGGLLSPVGPVLLTFPLTLLRRQDVLANVQEWKSTDFAQSWAKVFLLVVALGVVGLVRRPSYRSAIPLVVFTVAGAMAGRNVVVASVVLVPIVARGLADIGSLRDVRTGATRMATVALVALTPVFVVSNAAVGDFQLTAYPVSTMDWLQARGLLDGSTRIVEQDFVGNYIEWRYGPTVPAFIDDRYDLHDRSLVRDYLALQHGTRGWRDVLDQRNVDVVVWNRDGVLAELLSHSDGWTLAFDSSITSGVSDATKSQVGVSYVVYCRAGVSRCFG